MKNKLFISFLLSLFLFSFTAYSNTANTHRINTAILTNSKGEVFISNNLGKTWIKQSNTQYKSILTLSNREVLISENNGKSWYSIGKKIETDNIFDYTITPTPAKDIIKIQHNYEKTVMVSVYNIFGQLVLSEELDNMYENVLEIKNLSNGLYHIRISDSNTILGTKIIIKSN